MKLGTPKYTSEKFNKINRWELTEKVPAMVLKILPPLGELADAGQWYVFGAIHFVEGTNRRWHTFYCPEETTREGQVLVSCPFCTKQVLAQSEYDNKKNAGVDDTYLTTLKGLLRKFNVKKGWYLNAMNKEGLSGLLFLKTTAKRNLIDAFNKIKEKGLDPIVDGVYFEFSRTGKGFDTKYPVTAAMENVQYEGRMMFDIKREPLTDAQVAHIDSAEFGGSDLTKISRRLTMQEIELLASGDPTTVDRIFGSSKQADTAATPPPAPSTKAAPVGTPTQAPLPRTAPVNVPNQGPRMQTTTVAPQATTRPVPQATPAPAPQSDVDKMSDEDLLNLYKTDGLS